MSDWACPVDVSLIWNVIMELYLFLVSNVSLIWNVIMELYLFLFSNFFVFW